MVIANPNNLPYFPQNPIAKFVRKAMDIGGRVVRGAVGAVVNLVVKPIRNFVDSNFRPKVIPVAGSVMYCDLWRGAEHSGIYVADGQISNIVVTGFADSEVKLSDADDFTSKSTFGKKIYVSCNKQGAVGSDKVAKRAESKVGEKSFYGLVIKNCHEFSKNCLTPPKQNQSETEKKLAEQEEMYDDMTANTLEVEKTIRLLKKEAKKKLGATKWLLWDLGDLAQNEPEPDWQAQDDFFKNQPLSPEYAEALRRELQDMQDYMDEIADENIPSDVIKKLRNSIKTMQKVSDKYDEMQDFLKACPDAEFSYQELVDCQNQDIDFADLARKLQHNEKIKELAKKMGRNHISEQRKKQSKIPTMSKSEVHGVQRSNDLMRLLPSELVNLEDETLETLFYARLLENNLLTYELSGTTLQNHEENEDVSKQTGPVVACLDTSASMQGEPLNMARALLFAIANILKKEKRSLHVVLFGSSGQTKEYTLSGAEDLAGLLKFLGQGFGGGTDFETPLQKAVEIVQNQEDYQKADILMISDGDCRLSDSFANQFNRKKQQADCMVYSVLCNGQRVADNFSDEIVVL